jgi:hypothetical protein
MPRLRGLASEPNLNWLRYHRNAMSALAHWLTDEVVFRFVYRLDGKPKYSSSVTPNNGGNPQSPFVALAAR